MDYGIDGSTLSGAIGISAFRVEQKLIEDKPKDTQNQQYRRALEERPIMAIMIYSIEPKWYSYIRGFG